MFRPPPKMGTWSSAASVQCVDLVPSAGKDSAELQAEREQFIAARGEDCLGPARQAYLHRHVG